MSKPGARPAEIGELTRVDQRISFLYLERCVIHRESNAITALDDTGERHIPTASLGVLLLGPGTKISHQAMMLIAESGSNVVWVGERGVRYYAHGRGLSRNSRLLEAQAYLVTRPRERLRVARMMYEKRFPGEDLAGLTMQQLRGREGSRVRNVYRQHSKRTGVPWGRRDYKPEDFEGGDAVNQALSAANASLYGVVHSVIVAFGCSPGLGFVHTGHSRSFVYDMADLYKAELTIPLAFDIAADPPLDIGAETRRQFRDLVHDGKLLARCAADLQELLAMPGGANEDHDVDDDPNVELWDGGGRTVEAGANYGPDDAVEPGGEDEGVIA